MAVEPSSQKAMLARRRGRLEFQAVGLDALEIPVVLLEDSLFGEGKTPPISDAVGIVRRCLARLMPVTS